MMTMIELVLTVWLTLVTLAAALLYYRVKRLNAAIGNTLKAVGNILETMTIQADVNMTQNELNNYIGSNLEILGVHTNLIRPTIGYEATQFLAWYNKRKEGNNG